MNLRQERLLALKRKRAHVSLKAGQMWKSVSHAIRRLEACDPIFVGLDRSHTVVIFDGDVIGASEQWWDYHYHDEPNNYRVGYNKPGTYMWFETVSYSLAPLPICSNTLSQPFIHPSLAYANVTLPSLPISGPAAGHHLVSLALSTVTTAIASRPFLLDSGSTHPLGFIDDICELDPTGELPPQAIMTFDTTRGRIERFVYQVYMQMRDGDDEPLTAWHSAPFAVNEHANPMLPRLSGLFPFMHAYWVKEPEIDVAGGTWRASSTFSGAVAGVRKGLGDDLEAHTARKGPMGWRETKMAVEEEDDDDMSE